MEGKSDNEGGWTEPGVDTKWVEGKGGGGNKINKIYRD